MRSGPEAHPITHPPVLIRPAAPPLLVYPPLGPRPTLDLQVRCARGGICDVGLSVPLKHNTRLSWVFAGHTRLSVCVLGCGCLHVNSDTHGNSPHRHHSQPYISFSGNRGKQAHDHCKHQPRRTHSLVLACVVFLLASCVYRAISKSPLPPPPLLPARPTPIPLASLPSKLTQKS